MAHSKASRIRRFQAAIDAGRAPALKSYLAEAKGIAVAAGLIPNVDVFIPNINYDSLSPKDKRIIRDRFRNRMNYKLGRERLGLTYTATNNKLREQADKLLGDKQT